MPEIELDEYAPEMGDIAAKPKRKRRTKEELEAAGYYEAKERGEKPDKAPSGRKPKSYANKVAGIVVPLNKLVRSVPYTAADAMTDDEVAQAILVGDMAAQRYPKFRKLIEQAETATLAGAVLSLAFSVGLRVAANHNLLPTSIRDAMLAGAASQVSREKWSDEALDQIYEQYPQYANNGGMPTVTPVFPSGR